ncbi:hypothetical protein GCM10010168_67090 [Actinoplanes ianthinogenes]|uniref:Tight adherence protein B n=1 Tax=Actinoplanes ianthinogenes TaxID=122358 RepID=A0ABN6CEF4_9ACTN|nr:hypothetical protein [Actinoplanes ianthinogenes]BCJ43906.1 hypothetical protein Aiant_45630 [Actinoplanes ianthinogenes]GGR39123.1 hypothetical protein GCM10010168_67090 [Actinoplanes ianthinogenes]
MIGVPAACLVGCVAAIAWPGPGVLARLSGRTRGFSVDLSRLRRLPDSLDRRAVFVVTGAAALAGFLLGGPVAALVLAVYGGLATRAWARRGTRKRAAATRAAALEALAALVADLRAGLPPVMVNASGPVGGDERISRLSGAVWRLADHTGAPAADLLGRIEADARAADRAASTAAAQAAGAQVTAVLLAVLPLAGVGLGYLIGADPLHILLRTPVGAACAAGALLLQCGGLGWARRLMNGPR